MNKDDKKKAKENTKTLNKIMSAFENGSPNTDIMTLKEAQEYLKISEPTLRKLVLSGDVPGKKCGKQWRFSRKALEESITKVD
jgi:excisionase family DNA binding protein